MPKKQPTECPRCGRTDFVYRPTVADMFHNEKIVKKYHLYCKCGKRIWDEPDKERMQDEKNG